MPRAAKNAGDKPAPKRKRKAGAYKMPDPLPLGAVLTDIRKKQWSLGASVGKGGFGEIYLASEMKDGKVEGDPCHVIKIEPHENGPLFCELHFYQRAAKAELISGWKRKQKLKHLGVPSYIGSGQHEHEKTKYRFLVMERFGEDLGNVFRKNGKKFSPKVAYSVGLQMVDALEYLHAQGYAHADIKAANILLGYGPKAKDQVFLVDFGLASRYIPNGVHKEYKPDPKKAHDGTLEYTSIGAHEGISPSRRYDFEILGYNLVHWMSGSLPWLNINNESEVQAIKTKHSQNRDSFIKSSFTKEKSPVELRDFFKYVDDLDYDAEPNYNKIRELFKKGIIASGSKYDGKLNFDQRPRSISPKKSPGKRTRTTPRGKQAAKRTSESSDIDEAPPQPARKKTKKTVPPAVSSSSEEISSPQLRRAPKRVGAKSNTDSSDVEGTPPIPAKKTKMTAKQTVSSSGEESSSPRGRRMKSEEEDVSKRRTRQSNQKTAQSGRAKANGTGTRNKLGTQKRKGLSLSIATQTSPGLKGLKRTRKKAGN